MPRKPRIELVGKYHIINRGVEQRAVFEDWYVADKLLELMKKAILSI